MNNLVVVNLFISPMRFTMFEYIEGSDLAFPQMPMLDGGHFVETWSKRFLETVGFIVMHSASDASLIR